ncbi:MAG: dihydroorotase [Acidimicrobiales bacterium]
MVNQRVLIRGGRIFDGERLINADVRLSDDRVVEIAESLSSGPGETVLDASDGVVSLSLCDLHTHTRLPGDGEAETLEGVTWSALLGGYSVLVSMANTTPVIDRVDRVHAIRELYARSAITFEVGASVTLERAGERLVDFNALTRAGVRWFSDDGSPVEDGLLLEGALRASRQYGFVVAQHAQDRSLARDGVINEGEFSDRTGVPGMPELAESAMVARDLEIVRSVGGRYHLMHVSSLASVALINRAVRDGLSVTAEVTPHHLYFDDEFLYRFDANLKVNPPIRSTSTRDALREAFLKGEIQIVATDHAPHPPWTKEASYRDAPFGLIGLQSAWSATLSSTWDHTDSSGAVVRSLRALSTEPRRLLGLPYRLEVGVTGDLSVFLPDQLVTLRADQIASASVNAPYVGETLRGSVRHVVVGGVPLVVDGELMRDGGMR